MDRNIRKRRLYERLKTAILRFHSWTGHWMRRTADMHRLRGMDERQLKDIGVNSRQIASSIEQRIDLETRMKNRTKKRPPFS